MKGKSGATHQIDVYWEFKLAGTKYRTCIECKHFNTAIKKLHIAAFATILDDIGNATGIFATTVGFQKGAVQLAKQTGIRLVLVNNLIKTVNITILANRSDTLITDIKYDMNQAKERLRERELAGFCLEPRWQKETKFFNATGDYLMTLDELLKDNASSNVGVIEPENIYDLTPIGLIRVKSISYKIITSNYELPFVVTANDISKAIMEDVLENHILYLNDDLTITENKT
jgi:hypothetical protein